MTNYPIGVGINGAGEVTIADNHNNFNLSVFSQDGKIVYFNARYYAQFLQNELGSSRKSLAKDNCLLNKLFLMFAGQLLSALESKVKHAQCFDVALMDDGSVVLASKDYRLYIYRYVQLPPIGMLN